MRRAWLALALALFTTLAVAQGAPPSASLDRTRVGSGETVTLNIEVGENDADNPDLSPLAADFIVLGTSTNRSLSIVNGRREAHTILGVALRPRHEGHLTVPALTIGSQKTQPLSLDVEAGSSGPGDAADRPVTLEGKADPAQGYVGQQFDYTLRLYFAVNLADGQLGDPTAEGAEVRRVGADANYQTVRGGRRFNVVERHYAIIPQRAGALTIQPPTFQGTAVDPTDMNSFFGGGETVNAVAQPVRVDVRARPGNATDGTWLPARSLKLSMDGVPADGKARVGQPMTLDMRLDATGLPFEALPALSLPSLDGADVYPDKAVTGDSTSGPWITGRRQQGFAVVPTRPGKLHIPETTLHWWNVVTDKAEVATLPARDIEVAAAIGAAAQPALPTQAVPAATASASVPAAPAAAAPGGVPWRLLAFAFVALWVLTLVAWLVTTTRRRRRVVPAAPPVPRASPPRPAAARDAFFKALATGDLAASERTLVAWAQAERPDVRSLAALSAALSSATQHDAVAALQRARYAGAGFDAEAVRTAFSPGFAWRVPDSGGGGGPLPPLYPR